MVVALSRFKVANACEDAVREAFLNRPGLVDHVPGFLGLEAFSDAEDASLFYLITRWTDVASFRQWHAGPDHKLAHQGIPKGLKLDASFTLIRTLERISEPGALLNSDGARDAATLVSEFLNRSASVYWLKTRSDGSIVVSNAAIQTLLGRESLEGIVIWSLLTQPDADRLREVVDAGARDPGKACRLNFVGRHQAPITLECRLDVHPEGFELIGESIHDDEARLQDELMELNNQLAVQLRENDRQTKALRRAKADLEQAVKELLESQLHLANLQAVIPICMICGKVKSSESKWEDVVAYFKRSNLSLSHGYCPDCFAQEMEKFGQ
jgi:heme-degrading monooxygenase HmoA